MSHLVEFKAVLELYDEGSFTARLVPFGVESPYGQGTVEFALGSLTYTASTPLTVDHGDSVFDRIGVMARHFETKEGAYGEFQLSDTEAGRTMRTLLLDGAVTDVSVGVRVDNDDDGVMFGELDHVSLVSHGRFGRTENPSKILAVHDDKEPSMGEEKVETAPVVEVFDDSELKEEMMRLAEHVDTLENRVVDEPELFTSLGDMVVTAAKASALGDEDAAHKMALFADTNTTTTGAGVVPDFLSAEYLSIIASSRVFLGNIPSDPIGAAGMTVEYPKKTSGPSVAVQSNEFDPVSSTAMPIGLISVDLLTYAGANSVSQQLIARSQPSFVDILFRELAGQYAQVTDAASIASAVAGAGGTAILADLGADAAATFAAFQVGNSAIIAGVRAPGNVVFLAADRWAELNSLVDTDGRPLLVFGANGPMNAQGQSQFNTMVAQYHGWVVRLDVDAANGTCLIMNSEHVANLESSPTQLSALQVSTLSTDFGIWGLQNIIIKFPEALYTLTPS